MTQNYHCRFCSALVDTRHAGDCVSTGRVQRGQCAEVEISSLERHQESPGYGVTISQKIISATARLDHFDKQVATITYIRGEDYGPPRADFERAQKIKAAVADCPDPAMRHVLEMIGVKMARLCVTPTHLDSLIDIAGYARTGVMVSDDILPGGSRYNKQAVANVAPSLDRIATDNLQKRLLALQTALHSIPEDMWTEQCHAALRLQT